MENKGIGSKSYSVMAANAWRAVPFPVWGILAVLALVAIYAGVSLSAANGRIAALEDQRQALQRQKDDGEVALSALRKQVDELKGNQARLEDERNKVVADVKAIGAQLAQANDRVRTLESELSAAKTDVQGKSEATARLAQQLAQVNAAATDATAKAEARISALERDLNAVREGRTAAETKAAALQQVVEKLTAQLGDLQRKLDQAAQPPPVAQ